MNLYEAISLSLLLPSNKTRRTDSRLFFGSALIRTVPAKFGSPFPHLFFPVSRSLSTICKNERWDYVVANLQHWTQYLHRRRRLIPRPIHPSKARLALVEEYSRLLRTLPILLLDPIPGAYSSRPTTTTTTTTTTTRPGILALDIMTNTTMTRSTRGIRPNASSSRSSRS